MRWLRPYGKNPPDRGAPCPVCGGPITTSYVPVDRAGNLEHQMRYCKKCRVGWSLIDKGTDYRMFQNANGKWRARPR